MGIQYNYPVEQLDSLIEQISKGITPLMTPALKAEVALRYQELQHEGFEDDDDEDYRDAVQKHDDAMRAMEEKRRRSHSRDILIIDLTPEEQQQLSDDMEMSYIRSDPNSVYNISDEDLSSDEERRQIFKKLQSIGKIYYHAEDYRNAIAIIRDAIEYSLRHDYPWLSYEQACAAFREGRIKYTYAQIPLLYIDYDTQLTDPVLLAGVAKGEINLIENRPATEQKRKRPKNVKAIEVPYTVIGPAEHAEYVKIHQAGYNTPISTILKSCSTIYNRYVMPSAFSFTQSGRKADVPPIDWTRPGAGDQYFEQMHGIQRDRISEIVTVLNEQNDGQLRHTFGSSMKKFLTDLSGQKKPTGFKSISTSLLHDDKVVEMENHILDMIRATNPNL